MDPFPPEMKDTERLGVLAMRFRGTRQEAERKDIARDYAQTVARLIQSGAWDEAPGPEHELPDDWMPQAFFEYWLRPQDAILRDSNQVISKGATEMPDQRGTRLQGIERELGEAARELATAILDAGGLKDDQRSQVGAEIERQLKRFAEVVAKKIKEEERG